MNNIIKSENGRQPATFGSVVDQIFQNNLNRFQDKDKYFFWIYKSKKGISQKAYC
jgi:HSP20 family protein